MDDYDEGYYMAQDTILCHACGKEFYKYSTFESHMKWKHSDKGEEYMCELCGRTFQKKYNLLKHMESGAHYVSESVNCTICEFRSINRKLMYKHYQNYHKVMLREQTYYFKTVEDFFLWKSSFEKRTRARFVKMSSSRQKKNGYLRSTYFCHRDGNFIPKGKNLRHPKMKGSNKINAHCPAKIDVEMGDNIIVATCVETHLGHELDPSRLSLEPEEKALIAEKLAMKVPFEQILEEVNKMNTHTVNGEIRRLNMLTRKDLWNIVDTFKLNPKDVVYSKTRMRKNKILGRPTKKEIKFENTIVGPKIEKVKFVNGSISEEENAYSMVADFSKGQSNVQMISPEDGNVVYCPVVFKGENEEYQEYALVTEDLEGREDQTCLVVNAQGNVERLNLHQLMFGENGDLRIDQNQDDENSTAAKLSIDDKMYMVVNESENVPESEEVVFIKNENDSEETTISNDLSENIEHTVSNLSSDTSKSLMTITDTDQFMQTLVDNNIIYVDNIDSEKTSVGPQFVQVQHFSQAENGEYEMAVDEDGNQYVIISAEEEEQDISLAERAVEQVKQQVLGSDFLNENNY